MATPGTLTAVALLVGGLAFTAIAALGLYRLPDCYSRAHATSKSETLGALLALSAVAVAFGEVTTTIKLGALAVFLLVTSPTAAHAIVRSADDQGIDPWRRPAGADDHEGDDSGRGPTNVEDGSAGGVGGDDGSGRQPTGEGGES
jgi:multicomponent Na+:H+ antiporter subunit G